MRLVPRLSILAATALLGACAANSYCTGEQKYQSAPSLPPLQPAEGLQLPESPSALRIPPEPPNPVPYGQTFKDEDGDERVSCLDKPPEMPERPRAPAPAATPDAPAPAAPAPDAPPPDEKPAG